MRLKVCAAAVLFLICLLAESLIAQANPDQSVVSRLGPGVPNAVKDPNGTAVLAQLVVASGWTKAAVPSDAVVTGTITRYLGENSPTATFTLKIRGAEQYRYAEDASSVVVVTNGPAGALVGRDGKTRRIPPHSALNSRGLVLPMATVISDWSASDVDVTLVGSSTIGGEACIGVQLARRFPDSDPLAKVRHLISPTVVWISTTRGVALRADYYRAAIDNQSATIRETVLYSDYRNINGIAVPFRQDVSIGELKMSTLQFSTVRFNTGLGDADFNVVTMAGGVQ